jgi:hypothetical protein
MSVVDSMKGAWHKHPYLIMGLGGVIVLYFLWPSKKSSGSSSAPADTYGQQLAAETALSQSQLAEQAQVALGAQQATTAQVTALDAATAASNEAIAQSNAAAIVAYNQTAQASITAEGNLAVAQTATGSTDFQALIAGLTGFGSQATTGATTASANGTNAYLTSIGAAFSNTNGPNSFTASDVGPGGYVGVANMAVDNSTGTLGWGFGATGHYGAGTPAYNNAGGASLSTDVNAAASPFTASDNLLASLWSQAISSYNTNQASIIKTLPTITPATSPILVGNVQTIGH